MAVPRVDAAINADPISGATALSDNKVLLT